MLRQAIATLALLTLAGCTGIPNEGPVEVGGGEAIPDPRVFPVQPPGPGDEPVDIVEGFVEAMPAGVAGDFGSARDYLTPEARADWDPAVRVTIYGSAAFEPLWDEEAATVTYVLPVVAFVDEHGILTEAEPGTRSSVVFTVANEVGEWRISDLDDGLVISDANFSVLYREVELAWATQDLSVIVPDVRWFPDHNVATRAAEELVAGPAPWLADAVATGLTPIAELGVASVPVEDGVASVSLDAASVTTPANRSLALSQFTRTLAGLPDVLSVDVTVGGLPIGGDGSVTLAPPPVRSGRAVALVSGRLGSWDGVGFQMPASGDDGLPVTANSPAISYDGLRTAFLVGTSELVTAPALSDALTPLTGGIATSSAEITPVFSGARLVEPSFDRHGWLWSGEVGNAGSLVAIGPGGPLEVPVPWLAGREVAEARVSADGARIAILSREGGVWLLSVAGLVRTDDGVPVSIGEPIDIGVGIGAPGDLVWVDDTQLAVLSIGAKDAVPSLVLVTVGGRTTMFSTVPGAVSIAARLGTGSLAIVTGDGGLYVRSNTTWARVGGGFPVTGLAFAG